MSTDLIPNYTVAVYNEAGHYVLQCQDAERVCTSPPGAATAPIDTSRTFTAHVFRTRDPGLPDQPDRAVSNTVRVTNVGWVGTVALTASSTSYINGQQAPTLTATITPRLSSGLSLIIRDNRGGTTWVCRDGETTCIAANRGTAPLDSTTTYTAYVTMDDPWQPPATPTYRAVSEPVSIAKHGWTGTVALGTTADVYANTQEIPTLTATITPALSSGTTVTILGSDGSFITSCADYGTTCTAPRYGRAPVDSSMQYTAYVTTGEPTDIKAAAKATSAAVTIHNRGWQGTVTLTTSANSYTDEDDRPTLTATVSPALNSGTTVTIMDEGGEAAYCNYGTSCVATKGAQAFVNQTTTYTAYVHTSERYWMNPASTRAASGSVTVTHLPLVWTLSLDTQVDGTNAKLLTTVNHSLTRFGYQVAVFNRITGALVGTCTDLVCTFTVPLPNDVDIAIYGAYILPLYTTAMPGPGDTYIAASSPKIVGHNNGEITGLEFLASPAGVAFVEKTLAAGATAERCAALSPAMRRTNYFRSTVSDAQLVCDSAGFMGALRLAAVYGGAQALLEVLNNITNFPNDHTQPGCNRVDSVGDCKDEYDANQIIPDPSPEPEPNPSGGIAPPPNCLIGQERQHLLDSMPDTHGHHIASYFNKGGYKAAFNDILKDYKSLVPGHTDEPLVLNSDDADLWEWNRLNVRHKGPHPREYHEWVYKNMRAADNIAQGDTQTFVDKFREFTAPHIAADPTIVRPGYWRCRR